VLTPGFYPNSETALPSVWKEFHCQGQRVILLKYDVSYSSLFDFVEVCGNTAILFSLWVQMLPVEMQTVLGFIVHPVEDS
jgi:hypothetical protein